MGTPLVRKVDHAEQDGGGSLLNVVSVLDAVDGGGPVDAQAPHLIGFHELVGRVEPSVADEREEDEGGLAELERHVVLIHETDAAYEGGLGRVGASR